MAKLPDAPTRAWLAAAELAAGRGSGWPARFAELAAEAAARGLPGATTVTRQHIHNISAGTRPATDDMRRLLLAVGPAAMARLWSEATQLQRMLEEIRASLPPPATREYTKEQYDAETEESMAMLNEMAGIKPTEGDDK